MPSGARPRRLGKRLVGFCGLGPGDLYLLEGLLQLCLLTPLPPLFSVTGDTVARDRRHARGGEIFLHSLTWLRRSHIVGDAMNVVKATRQYEDWLGHRADL